MSLCKELPFKKLKKDKLINYIKKSLNPNTEQLESFLSYFIDRWVKYFNDKSLFLEEIKIKFCTNNCLENFNKQINLVSELKETLIF